MLHMPQILAIIALDLVSIIPLSLILITSGCSITLVTTLPLGPWAIVTGVLIVSSLTPHWVPVIGSSLVHFEPL